MALFPQLLYTALIKYHSSRLSLRVEILRAQYDRFNMRGYDNLLRAYQMLLAGFVQVNTYTISMKIEERRGKG